MQILSGHLSGRIVSIKQGQEDVKMRLHAHIVMEGHKDHRQLIKDRLARS